MKAPRGPHARLGASSAHRWMRCPGSIRMSDGIAGPTTLYQLEGTAAHALAEHALSGRSPTGWAGGHWREIVEVDVELEDGGIRKIPVTDEMRDAVQLYVDTVRGLETETSELLTEQSFSLSALAPPEPMFGTADAVLLDQARITVVDFKYGQGVTVEVEDNDQLRMYAVGALLLAAGSDGPWTSDVPEIATVIVQPRTAHVDGTVRTRYYTNDEIKSFARELMRAAAATRDPSAPLVPGEKQCRFCPARGHCPALAAAAQDAAADAFALAPLDAPELLPDVTRMPIEVVSELYQRAPLVRTFLTALEQRITAELSAGGVVPGFKLVEKRAQRVWAEEGTETARALVNMGLEEHEVYDLKLKSPAQIEKIIGKHRLPQEMVTRVVNGVTLTTEDDPRPAVTEAQVVFPALSAPKEDPES